MARPASRCRLRSSPSGISTARSTRSRFTPEGRYLAAVGDGTMIWLAEMEPRVRQIRDLGTPPHHFEQINTLAIWPGSWTVPTRPVRDLTPGLPAFTEPRRHPMLISGSDDTTIEFWDLEKRCAPGNFLCGVDRS